MCKSQQKNTRTAEAKLNGRSSTTKKGRLHTGKNQRSQNHHHHYKRHKIDSS